MKKTFKEACYTNKWLYIFVFAMPFIIMYVVYALFHVHPFGNGSVLVLDLNGQYVYYYEALRDAVWGKSSLIYSWSRNLSGEMFGIFAYYLASPFSIITLIFPRSMLLTSLKIMQLCKIGAASVTCAVYLRHSKNTCRNTTVIFSILYAMMSYTIVQLMNPMWVDGVVFLPLIILGLEKLIDGGKMTPFIVPLAIMFIANFYIGYMIGFFVVLYSFYYYFSKDKLIGLKPTFKAIGKLIVSVVVAVLCACIILIPVYNSLKLGKLEFTQPDFTMKSQFAFDKFFSKLLPFSYDTVTPQGLPIIFCGSLTVLLSILYFTNSKITVKKRTASALLLSALLLCMYVSTIDIAWHGFQVPNWLPYRYSFTFSFVMIIISAECIENFSGVTKKSIVASFAGVIAFVFYVQSRGFKHFDSITDILPIIIVFVVYLFILYALRRKRTRVISWVLFSAVCAEMLVVGLDTLRKIDADVVYSSYSSYHDYVKDGRDTVNKIKSFDDGLYRTEKTYFRTVNDPMGFGMKGLSHSSSTLNASAINMLGKLGFTSRGHYTRYSGATYLTDALFGVKYVLDKENKVPDYERIFTSNGVGVYKNSNALPVGYMVKNEVRNVSLYDMNVFENQNYLLNTMVDSPTGEFVLNRIYANDIVLENVLQEFAGDHIKYSPIEKNKNAHVEFKITAIDDNMIYAYFPSNYERQMNVWVNGKFITTYYEGDDYCIIELGKFKAGDEISVITTPLKEDLYMTEQCFYSIDTALLKQYTDTLKEGGWNITKHTDTYLEGSITAKDNQIMFTTIPYENGWTIKVDGKKVKPVVLVDSLIGIEVPEGTHTVTMHFLPGYFIEAVILSFVGLILLAFIFVYEYKDKLIRKKEKKSV